jgi:hypothetical protein
LLFAPVVLAGCAGGRLVTLAIDPVVQSDAPVQIVSITPRGDNMLATVTVKNMTGRDIQDFDISWAIFRPVNCAASGPATRLHHLGGGGQSASAEMRGTRMLMPGERWGNRALKAQEQTEITTLTLSRDSLSSMAREANAKKLRVQVGIAYADFQPEPGVTYHVGPDWRNVTWERAGNLFDLDDAARQACS